MLRKPDLSADLIGPLASYMQILSLTLHTVPYFACVSLVVPWKNEVLFTHDLQWY